MSKKTKKKNIVAEDLIDSLMEDLKDISPDDSSIDLDPENVFSSEETGAHSLGKETSPGMNIGLMPDENREIEGGGSPTVWKSIDSDSSEESEAPKGLDLDSEGYQGPSAGGGYQSFDDLMGSSEQPPPYPSYDSDSEGSSPESEDYSSSLPEAEDDHTRPVNMDSDRTASVAMTDPDRTQAAEGFMNVGLGRRPVVEEKVGVGVLRGGKIANVMTSIDASLVQAENLKLAQSRILELENEVEKLRAENEELASAGEIIKTRSEESVSRLSSLEKEKQEQAETFQSEIGILKGSLQFKETELAKSRLKIEELEARLKNDFKKIRVRERELENRLELVRAEKSALVRSKDEYILDLKRKIDQLQSELDNYRSKVIELNKTLESNQDQFKRTVRALRLALTNLESKDENLVPLKKAE